MMLGIILTVAMIRSKTTMGLECESLPSSRPCCLKVSLEMRCVTFFARSFVRAFSSTSSGVLTSPTVFMSP